MTFTIVFEYDGLCYNHYSSIVPRVGEMVIIDYSNTVTVTSVTYDLGKSIAYLSVKNS